jgi:hypothetical protein
LNSILFFFIIFTINLSLSLYKSVDLSSKSSNTLQSTTYWRKQNIKYTINEIYCDIIEELDGIIDKQGNVVNLEISGTVRSNAQKFF